MAELLKRELIPYKIPFQKIRFGKAGDGGYVIFNHRLSELDGMYSYGINDDVSFDMDFVGVAPNVPVYMFDHTIAALPAQHPNFMFIREPGNVQNIIKHIRMTNAKSRALFLKMDIEGHEWDLFDQLDEVVLNQFEQLTVEFHNLAFLQNNVFGGMGITYEKMARVFAKLNRHFYLGHIHGNNHGGYKIIPNTIECTYVRKDLCEEVPPLETAAYPVRGLDFPNGTHTADYVLDWWVVNA